MMKQTQYATLATIRGRPSHQNHFASTGAKIVTRDKPLAYFAFADDLIHMPPIETFRPADSFYATVA